MIIGYSITYKQNLVDKYKEFIPIHLFEKTINELFRKGACNMQVACIDVYNREYWKDEEDKRKRKICDNCNLKPASNECEECPYHFKCDIEQAAWNDILYGDD